jgi:hypothetical protein
MRAFRAALACVLATFALPPLCRAQEPRPGWVEDFTVLSANVLVSAVSAGAAQHVPGVRLLSRWFDADLSVFGIAGLAAVIDEHDARPWEIEASALAGR